MTPRPKSTRVPRNGRHPLDTFELELPSRPHEVSRVEGFLKAANRRLGLDDGTLYRLLVAATEAVNNAIIHGNRSDPDRTVHVFMRATSRRILLRVEDEGQGFDAQALPSPLEEENLLKDHGRGVFLIRSLMDEVRFIRLRRGSAAIMVLRLDRMS